MRADVQVMNSVWSGVVVRLDGVDGGGREKMAVD